MISLGIVLLAAVCLTIAYLSRSGFVEGLFARLCVIPAALIAWVLFLNRQSSIALLAPLVLGFLSSIALSLFGAGLVLARWKKKMSVWPVVLPTVIAALPAAFLLFRRALK